MKCSCDAVIRSKIDLDGAPLQPQKTAVEERRGARPVVPDAIWGTEEAFDLSLRHAGDDLAEPVNRNCMAACKEDQDTRGDDKQQRPYDYEDSSSMAHG